MTRLTVAHRRFGPGGDRAILRKGRGDRHATDLLNDPAVHGQPLLALRAGAI